MGYHAVYFLHCPVKLDGLTMIFVASGSGFFVGPLHIVLIGLLLDYFTIFHILYRAMHQACFVANWTIAWIACMIILSLDIAALLGVGCQGIFCSLMFPDVTGTVGICPSDGFRRCSSFVYFILNLHALEHLACFLVGILLTVPAL